MNLLRSGSREGKTMPKLKGVVLVVEDNQLIRIIMSEIIEASGFECISVSNARTAISILSDRPDVQVVFTDIEMPGEMDGVELAHLVRNRWPSISLIVTSGKGLLENFTLPKDVPFFRKPYDNNAILEVINNMVSEKREILLPAS